MKTVVVDYGSGNLRSAAKALERVSPGPVEVTDRPEVVSGADYLVVPGQGAFADCRQGLRSIDGLYEAIADFALTRARPFLGICIGMQLMATQGLEHGAHDGFGWIPGAVEALTPAPGRPVPHMGWNDLTIKAEHPLLAGVESGAHAYFVHSYAFRAADPSHVLAETDYGLPVVAVIGRDNLVGTQFHPEKSQETGLRLIANFLSWTP